VTQNAYRWIQLNTAFHLQIAYMLIYDLQIADNLVLEREPELKIFGYTSHDKTVWKCEQMH
jgi:hypothetical protein